MKNLKRNKKKEREKIFFLWINERNFGDEIKYNRTYDKHFNSKFEIQEKEEEEEFQIEREEKNRSDHRQKIKKINKNSRRSSSLFIFFCDNAIE